MYFRNRHWTKQCTLEIDTELNNVLLSLEIDTELNNVLLSLEIDTELNNVLMK